MRPICPHCHSANVTSNMPNDSPFNLFEQLCSQSALSGLGVSICRYYKINSAIGVVVGTALASAISLAKDKLQQPPLITLAARPSYTCNTCSRTFTI
ncbi:MULTISPECIES: hypothetical protein [Psychrobacter]|jgi:hypothetical protein|uniref:hypothetical protein n=1 Tax=Psychrobacter TaxID=497 RepID=UPI000C7BE9E9|nr:MULTISPECIES: hypothetical protein [Psychrobacter]PKH82351.1 hypothetical protein CXF60_01680 [Psychrobacter sp. 4Bb]